MRMGEFSARVYRVVFSAAAMYNVAFGLWAAVAPHAFFNLFRLDAPRYPAIWACLGMVVGLYGAGYAYAAWRLDRAFPFIAIGLTGKVLGPIGWLMAVRSHELPFRTVPLIVFDDLIWWLPFALFLLEPTAVVSFFKKSAPYWCAAIHFFAAIAAVTLLRGANAHTTGWRAGWLVWMIAAQSLLGFYAWWGGRVPRVPAIAAFVIAGAGILCDYAGESMLIIAHAGRVAWLLTGGAANALYTLAGVLLTIATPAMRPLVRSWAWLVWICGAALTILTIANSATGVMMSSAALMLVFVPWVVAMAVTSR
jgi:hypothetical protein